MILSRNYLLCGLAKMSRASIFAVTVAVCEIFSAKEWCNLENRVRVRSR